MVVIVATIWFLNMQMAFRAYSTFNSIEDLAMSLFDICFRLALRIKPIKDIGEAWLRSDILISL